MSPSICVENIATRSGTGIPPRPAAENREPEAASRPLTGNWQPATGDYPNLCPTGFVLFLLVNVCLFIRPNEILPEIQGWPIYPFEFFIVLSLLASLPAVIPQLTWSSLKKNPVTLCILGLLPAVVLSHLSHKDLWSARMGAVEFAKIVIYYLLLVGLVDSPRRLRIFLLTITTFVALMALICVLNYHGIIHVPALQILEQGLAHTDEAGQVITVLRLEALGIFSDPNDFSLVLVTAMLVVMYLMTRRTGLLRRLLLLAPLALLGYAFALTRSRGGFISLTTGLSVLLLGRLGWKRSIPMLAVAIPLLLVLFGGRQTDINLDQGDTGMGRVDLWRDSIVLFHQHPVFGIGLGRVSDEIGHVSHNTYVQCYTELGMFGGTCFVGAVYLSIWGLRKYRTSPIEQTDPDLLAWRPFILAMTAAYCAGIYTLTRVDADTTYMVLGTAAAFLSLGASGGAVLAPRKLWRHLAIAGVGAIVFLEIFIRVVA